jgi:hypothetical protein
VKGAKKKSGDGGGGGGGGECGCRIHLVISKKLMERGSAAVMI